MLESKMWRAWAIKRNRLDHIVSFIKAEIPEIDKYFYPLIKKEYETKKGITVKDRPLYEGYLFLRYNDHASVYHKLRQSPFVTTYAGPVSQAEIDIMEASQGKLLKEIKTSRYRKGDNVILLDGPFKGFEAKVLKVAGDILKVRVIAKILGLSDVELAYSEDQVERKTELQNTKVQNI